MDKDLRVALFPMRIAWEDKKANFDTLQGALESMHPDTDLIILPETFSTGFPSGEYKEHVRAMAERNSGPTVEMLKRLAAHYNVAIAGSFIADSGGSLYNRAFFIEPSGEETFADKRHLFTMAGEHKVFSRGHDRLKVRYRGWNIALIVCYDLRFPVWCRNVGNDYDLLVAVANWPVPRVSAWSSLLVARAIENECYVCVVDCKGTDLKGFVYDGASAAIDFKGKDIGVAAPDGNIIYALLQRDKLDAFRSKFPAWADADTFSLER